ncbi:SLBB domain-containing protein [Nonomuraea dietziae]|uniref:SLBB domain-containing protein n=1 Tax=Nonomuraea dietziae TaxID=65515 RepID=UPI00361E94EC
MVFDPATASDHLSSSGRPAVVAENVSGYSRFDSEAISLPHGVRSAYGSSWSEDASESALRRPHVDVSSGHPSGRSELGAMAISRAAGSASDSFPGRADFGFEPSPHRSPAEDVPHDGPSGLSPPIPTSFAAFRAAVSSQAPNLDPGRPGLRVLLVLGVVAALVGGVYVWRSSPTPEPLAAPRPISGSAAPPTVTSVSTPTSPEVMVHVAGKVRRPGVYTLPGGSRVTDAVKAAGGVRSGAPMGSVNLARRLVDGEQIVVGTPAARCRRWRRGWCGRRRSGRPRPQHRHA